jgi:catechol 2,3-dioxygenase-like lactoylglutathione lyase family enzyme
MAEPPLLNQLDLVVRDIDATVAFYRRLGLDIPESAVWRTASGAHHVDLTLPNGFHLHFDSLALTRYFDSGWRDAASATTNVVGFAVASRRRWTTATRTLSRRATPAASRRSTPSGAPATPSSRIPTATTSAS